jgi:hypothetical protein
MLLIASPGYGRSGLAAWRRLSGGCGSGSWGILIPYLIGFQTQRDRMPGVVLPQHHSHRPR